MSAAATIATGKEVLRFVFVVLLLLLLLLVVVSSLC